MAALLHRGLLKADCQRYADALADFDALASAGTAEQRDLALRHRAACLARLGRHKEAWEHIETIRPAFGNQAAALHDAAAILALCAAAARQDAALSEQSREETVQQYVKAAVVLLEQWRTEGEPREPNMKKTLGDDPRFQALYDHDAFRLFLERL